MRDGEFAVGSGALVARKLGRERLHAQGQGHPLWLKEFHDFGGIF